MNLLTRTQHSYLDVLVVIVFALAPAMFDMTGAAATLSYILAAVHLGMSLLTADLPGAPFGLIPLPLHGLIEAAVGVILGVIGWLAFDGTDQTFFLVIAVLILLGFATTPYTQRSE